MSKTENSPELFLDDTICIPQSDFYTRYDTNLCPHKCGLPETLRHLLIECPASAFLRNQTTARISHAIACVHAKANCVCNLSSIPSFFATSTPISCIKHIECQNILSFSSFFSATGFIPSDLGSVLKSHGIIDSMISDSIYAIQKTLCLISKEICEFRCKRHFFSF